MNVPTSPTIRIVVLIAFFMGSSPWIRFKDPNQKSSDENFRRVPNYRARVKSAAATIPQYAKLSADPG
jgi:hypothetical protein